MAFVIKNIKGANIGKLFMAIRKVALRSRFNFYAGTTHDMKRIEIGKVRLRVAKDYCGNHPLPCPVRPWQPHQAHKKLTYLEGADWVAFNDMLNDVLDKLKVSADVASSHVIIRKGYARCVEYDAQIRPNGIDAEWTKDSNMFANYTGQIAPRAGYPNGTPGIPEYLTSKAKKYKIQDHEH